MTVYHRKRLLLKSRAPGWGVKNNKPSRTFSSSSFFSLKFFLLRAVSSLRSAISVSVRYFFFLELEVGVGSAKKSDVSKLRLRRIARRRVVWQMVPMNGDSPLAQGSNLLATHRRKLLTQGNELTSCPTATSQSSLPSRHWFFPLALTLRGCYDGRFRVF